MYSKVFSGTWEGMEGILIQVEADLSNGLPVFELVGYLSSEVKEAKERVRTALKNQGYYLPAKRITVNLAPAHIRKSGSAFDLAIGVSVLIASGHMRHLKEPVLFLGEIGLNGTILPVQGVLPVMLCALENGINKCILPKDNVDEGKIASKMQCIGVDSLNDVVDILNNWCWMSEENDSVKSQLFEADKIEAQEDTYDFSDIKGQRIAKRALEIAVSGHHNVLMVGNPGCGKSALAKRIPSIMPALTSEEMLELTKIYSISGELIRGKKLITKRPFRAPHHNITASALAGGGQYAGPGEMTLSHKGVLFLDEFPEFPRSILELMRQPLEEGKIIIARNKRTSVYPADFMLVAAMNPCPCGYYPDRQRCFCSERKRNTYHHKISGPLLDRIDLTIHMKSLSFEQMHSNLPEENSETIRKRVELCRSIQRERYRKEPYEVNAHLDEKGLKKYCVMSEKCEDILYKFASEQKLSYRSIVRILKVSRTIADMETSDQINENHVSEAILFRMGWQNER